MSDKDKKAFERWYIEQDEGGVFGNDDTTYVDLAWQAACEYMQAELAHRIFNLSKRIESLIAENDKLFECLSDIANEDYRGNRSSGSVKAYNCLKNLTEIKDK